jgi:hypothetical protein
MEADVNCRHVRCVQHSGASDAAIDVGAETIVITRGGMRNEILWRLGLKTARRTTGSIVARDANSQHWRAETTIRECSLASPAARFGRGHRKVTMCTLVQRFLRVDVACETLFIAEDDVR